jgi:hypothetical protein
MILKNTTKNFTVIPNELIADTEISTGAFKLYCYLASKPESWNINNKDITKQLKIGSKDTLAKYWRELNDAGWIEKSVEQDKSGKFTGKTILKLFNNRNPKNTEIGEKPNSQKNRIPKNQENLKSRIHSNTNPISKTDINIKTNKEKNIKKEDSLINAKTQELMTNLKIDEEFIKEVIEYRKAIKKPLATVYALNLLLNEILKVVLKYKVSAREVFEFIAGKQWQSIKFDWDEVKKEFGNQVQGANNNANNINTGYMSSVGQQTAQNGLKWLERRRKQREKQANIIDTETDF